LKNFDKVELVDKQNLIDINDLQSYLWESKSYYILIQK
jgi:hypothetical protein